MGIQIIQCFTFLELQLVVKQLQREGSCPTNQGERQLTKLRIRITCNQRTWWDESAIVCTRTWTIWDFSPRGGVYAAEQKAQSSYYKLMISYDKTLEIWDIRSSAEGLGEQNLLHHWRGTYQLFWYSPGYSMDELFWPIAKTCMLQLWDAQGRCSS